MFIYFLLARFEGAREEVLVAALAVRVVLPLVVPLALAFAAVLVDEVGFLEVVDLAGAFLVAAAFFVVAAFLGGAALAVDFAVVDLTAGFVAALAVDLAVEDLVEVAVFGLEAAVLVAVAGFALGLEAASGVFLVAGALEVAAFFVAAVDFFAVEVLFSFLVAAGGWFSLVSAAFLGASFTLPDGPFGREKTLVSAPRAMARLILVM